MHNCSDLGPDWYLPSENELFTISENIDLLSKSCFANTHISPTKRLIFCAFRPLWHSGRGRRA